MAEFETAPRITVSEARRFSLPVVLVLLYTAVLLLAPIVEPAS